MLAPKKSLFAQLYRSRRCSPPPPRWCALGPAITITITIAVRYHKESLRRIYTSHIRHSRKQYRQKDRYGQYISDCTSGRGGVAHRVEVCIESEHQIRLQIQVETFHAIQEKGSTAALTTVLASGTDSLTPVIQVWPTFCSDMESKNLGPSLIQSAT